MELQQRSVSESATQAEQPGGDGRALLESEQQPIHNLCGLGPVHKHLR
jgi:hypothetical protein